MLLEIYETLQLVSYLLVFKGSLSKHLLVVISFLYIWVVNQYRKSLPREDSLKYYYIIKIFHAVQCFLITFNLSYNLLNWHLVFLPYYILGIIYVLVVGILFSFWFGFLKKMFVSFCLNFILFLIFGYVLLFLLDLALLVIFFFYCLARGYIAFHNSLPMPSLLMLFFNFLVKITFWTISVSCFITFITLLVICLQNYNKGPKGI